MQQRRLIEKTADSSSQHSETIEIGRTEIAFHLLGFQGIVLDVVGCTNDAADVIGHAIARAPANLRCHIQRINLFITTKDEERLYGALLDLFIILADQGYPLRKRMLKSARSLICKEHFDVLKHQLESGLTVNKGLIYSPTSILSGELAPPNQLIKRLDSATSAQDPIEEACDHLEYGQVDAARQVLEAAIENTPDRNDLYQELLEIYRCTQDQVRYQVMYERLEAVNHPFFQRWIELANSFGSES